MSVANMRTETLQFAKLYSLKSLIKALKKATVHPAMHPSKYHMWRVEVHLRTKKNPP